MGAVRIAALAVLVLLLMGAGEGTATSNTDIVGLLREFGFPIFVSLWFMWRVEKRMDRFTDSIQNLLTAVTVMAKTVDDWTPAPRQSTNHDIPRTPQ